MKDTHKKNKGSALLLSLGILSLLLILAMSFSFTARTNRQSSAINADQVKVRLGSESALGWVLTAMRMNVEKKDTDTPYFFKKTPFNLIWYDKDAPFKNRSTLSESEIEQGMFISRVKRAYEGDEEEDLKKALDVGAHLPIVDKMLTDSTKTITELFPAYSGYYPNFRLLSNEDGYVTRSAYLVLEDSNKLDVNQALTLSKADDNRPFVKGDGSSFEARLARTGQSSSDDFAYNIAGYDASDNPKTSITESNTLRLGLNMQELQLNSNFFNNLKDGTNFRIPWLSYYHLVKKSSQYSGNNLFKYTFFSGDDIEAYWDGTNERQRFDITGAEWRPDADNAWEDGTVNSQEYANDLLEALCADSVREQFFQDYQTKELVSSPQVKTSPFSADSGFGIPHLNSLGNTGKQIAANMIDFCDNDSFATLPPLFQNKEALLSLDDASSGNFIYCGNERVPYFNEFALAFDGTKVLTFDDPDNEENNRYTFNFTASAKLELLQIYNDDAPAGECTIRVYINELACKIDTNPTPIDIRPFLIASGDLTAGSSGSDPYLELSFNYGTSSSVQFIVKEIEAKAIREVPNVKSVELSWGISKITMVSYDNATGNIYDAAWWQGSASGSMTPTNAIGNPQTASWEVTDPRVNHIRDNWTCNDFSTGDVGSMGKRNNNFPTATPSNADTEQYSSLFVPVGTSTKLPTFSTAFLPNRPFDNFWEVGAVHRGQAFRTVALLGDDAVFVDQLKIGPLKEHQGTYNINARNPIVLADFAKGIDIESEIDLGDVNTIDKIGDYELGIGYSTSSTFSTDGSDFTGSEIEWHNPSFSRSAAAPTFKAFNDNLSPKPTCDRAEEAFFTRTVPLLTTRNERFTIVVASQLLKQIEGISDDTTWNKIKDTLINPTKYNGEYYSIMTTHRIVAHVVMDAWRNQFKVVQLRYLED
ncbi:MAG: hypothetical protein IKP00_05990 [Victivallales bacterium]|nr:hypothetical protein [Victivallales bacterium]